MESVTAEMLLILSLCGVEWGEISKVILLSNPTVVLCWVGVLTIIDPPKITHNFTCKLNREG